MSELKSYCCGASLTEHHYSYPAGELEKIEYECSKCHNVWKTKEKEIEELIKEDIEKETRVEMKPVPPSQLNRIERMLKWVIVELKIRGRAELASSGYSPEAMGKQMSNLIGQLPDISDIING